MQDGGIGQAGAKGKMGIFRAGQNIMDYVLGNCDGFYPVGSFIRFTRMEVNEVSGPGQSISQGVLSVEFEALVLRVGGVNPGQYTVIVDDLVIIIQGVVSFN